MVAGLPHTLYSQGMQYNLYDLSTLRHPDIWKAYELSNHLGNACPSEVQRRWVLATISDKKIGVSSGGSLIDYYKPDIVSANDYYLLAAVA